MFMIILLSTFLTTLWLDWRMHGFVVVPDFLVEQESRRSVIMALARVTTLEWHGPDDLRMPTS